MSVIVEGMSDKRAAAWTTHEDHLERRLEDPTFRERWYATVLARAVSLAIIGHRTRTGSTQTNLAERLGMRQAQVSRMEIAEHTPTFDTLQRLADALDVEFEITIGPKREARRPVPKARRGEVADATDRVTVRVRHAG